MRIITKLNWEERMERTVIPASGGCWTGGCGEGGLGAGRAPQSLHTGATKGFSEKVQVAHVQYFF